MKQGGYTDIKPKKIIILYALISVVMVFFAIVGTKLNASGNIVWNAKTAAVISALSIGLGVVCGFAIFYATILVQKLIAYMGGRLRLEGDKVPGGLKKPWVIGIIAGVFILACYIPGFLACYPGICSYDAGPQAMQIFTNEYYQHHPLVHTLLIKACLNIGMAIGGSYETGIAVYSIIQMLIFAAVFAFGISVAFRLISQKSLLWAYIWSVIVAVFCGLFEYNRYMAITVTKDGLFAVFFLLQFVLFVCMLDKVGNGQKIKGLYAAYGISLVLCGVLRNNAIYALAVVIPIEALICLIKWIGYRRGAKTNNDKPTNNHTDKLADKPANNPRNKPTFETMLTVTTVAAVVLAFIVLKAVAGATNATPGDKREMLSVPIQQLARTAVYHSGQMVVPEDDATLDAESMALINDFFLYDSFKLYEPDISDPVKRNTNTYVARYRAKEFLKTYVGLLGKYPGDYVNAFVAVENGFLNINDTSHAFVNQKDYSNGMGYVQTHWDMYIADNGINQNSKWPALYEKMESWASGNKYLDYPIVRYFYMPGMYLYIFLFAFATLIKDNKKSLLTELGIVILYFATCLLGPTVQMRYVYPFVIICPFMLLMSVCLDRNEKENNKE
ncbi:MAG: DUF6020 family protein [Lachnospiraceae bacterium]|nr:DUF6020 family protein [Lachnospiraceae bacterium]